MKRTISLILAVLTLLLTAVSCSTVNPGGSTTEASRTASEPAQQTETPTLSEQETAAPDTTGSVPSDTATEVPTEVPTTEVPTEAPTTEVPTEVPSTEVPTEEPTTEVPTETPTPLTPTPTETPTPTPTETPGPADPAVVLKGKKALFCGDSIVMASTYDKDHQWWGWAGRINQYYGLKSYKNAGVDGASISDCRKTNVIINQVINNKGKYDFVILEGGTNDAWDVVDVGRLVPKPASETKTTDLDLSTFAGGLENVLFFAKKLYPDATIGYVITTQMNSSVGCVSSMARYVEVTKAACLKWGVFCLDLYNDEEFIAEYMPRRKTNTPDGIHPNSAGYEIYQKYIAQFMADIYGKTLEPVFGDLPGMVDVKSVLQGKKALFIGDSIGAKTSLDENEEHYAYAGRIMYDYELAPAPESLNRCTSGASISNCRGSNTIYAQTRGVKDREYDLIVIEGGVNDAWDKAPIGELTELTIDDLTRTGVDLGTLAGGLELLLCTLKKEHPEAVLVYVINYKLYSNQGSLSAMTQYVRMIQKACNKWGVQYLDLYNDGWFNAKFKVKTTEFVGDGIHPNTKGYDFMAPVIAEFMADAYVRAKAVDAV